MKNYEKPILMTSEELHEGVYLASGDVVAGGGTGTSGGCESDWMNGTFVQPKWGKEGTNIEVRGCQGCTAEDGDGCKLAKGEPKRDGTYKPLWEQKGEGPNDKCWG